MSPCRIEGLSHVSPMLTTSAAAELRLLLAGLSESSCEDWIVRSLTMIQRMRAEKLTQDCEYEL